VLVGIKKLAVHLADLVDEAGYAENPNGDVPRHACKVWKEKRKKGCKSRMQCHKQQALEAKAKLSHRDHPFVILGCAVVFDLNQEADKSGLGEAFEQTDDSGCLLAKDPYPPVFKTHGADSQRNGDRREKKNNPQTPVANDKCAEVFSKTPIREKQIPKKPIQLI
jgi:hypothetical protein